MQDRWDYTVIKHSQYLREGGGDFERTQSTGKEGWEMAAAYPVRGERVVSIFKRRR